MNLRRHMPVIAHLDHRYPALAYRLRVYFDLPARARLVPSLSSSSLCQADLVLALLRFGTPASRVVAERLVGRPITVCPSCLRRRLSSLTAASSSSSPAITYVLRDPPLRNSTRLQSCYSEFRVGRTRQQLISRGVSRGDIRRCIRRGWIRME